MKKSLFFFDLPQELIAQHPIEKRDESRLLLLERSSGKIEHLKFSDCLNYIDPGDCLVLNNTRVIPARLIGRKLPKSSEERQEGAISEVLLLRRIEGDSWDCLVRPGKRLKPGTRVSFGDGELVGEIVDFSEDGGRKIHFSYSGIFEEVLDRLGEMPLPPYIHEKLKDRTRYNTVYAKVDGSAAAPTAGLHFTDDLLSKARDKGIKIANVTLHVGLGTFRPVKEENILDHHMHSEQYFISEEDARVINETKLSGKRVIAVGTTSCRSLESAAKGGLLRQVDGEDTDIFIYPGFKFQIMDGIITNFHLPESTLLMLISAFAGRERVLAAYREAVEKRYRFFSFGDAMMII
ncbi:MAG: tRNA preQ1(34) S-adenosylmethionine ribosyltransferase-isomerase QueA [Lachnospiraceae bacterium]|nr:tRNA preQ1(34) S-adenosylmethionine ribosyltransferase-isomerase QueA [Lachnospiraceae bacterium]